MRFEQSSVSKSSDKRAVLAVALDILSTLLFVGFTFFLIYGALLYPSHLVFCVPTIGLSFLTRFLSARANVSYDYAIDNGNFIIGKIISNKKRKEIFVLAPQDILRVTVMTEHTGERRDKKTVYCTVNYIAPEGKSFVLLEIKDKIIMIEADEALTNALKTKVFY